MEERQLQTPHNVQQQPQPQQQQQQQQQQRIQQQQQQQSNSTAEKTRHRDTVLAWLRDTFYVGDSGAIAKATVYHEYLKLCERNNWTALSCPALGKIVHKAFPNVVGGRKGVKGKAVYHYKNLNFLRSQTAREDRPLPFASSGTTISQRPLVPLQPLPQQPLPRAPVFPQQLQHAQHTQQLQHARSQGQHSPSKDIAAQRRLSLVISSPYLSSNEHEAMRYSDVILPQNHPPQQPQRPQQPQPPQLPQQPLSPLFNVDDGGQYLHNLLGSLDRLKSSFSSSPSASFSASPSATTTTTTTSNPDPMLMNSIPTTTTTTTTTPAVQEEELRQLFTKFFRKLLLGLVYENNRRSNNEPEGRESESRMNKERDEGEEDVWKKEVEVRDTIRQFWMQPAIQTAILNNGSLVIFFLQRGIYFLLNEIYFHMLSLSSEEQRDKLLRLSTNALPYWAQTETATLIPAQDVQIQHNGIWLQFSQELPKRLVDDGQESHRQSGGYESL